jgi:hypothetical protein
VNGPGVIALLLASKNQTATSALPNAPVMNDVPGAATNRWDTTRGQLSNLLHRLAWRIEPGHQQAR